MKAILVRADLLKMISQHFDSDFKPEDITVRADPFEVEIDNIPFPDREGSTSAPPRPRAPAPVAAARDDDTPVLSEEDAAALLQSRADANASLETPPPGTDSLPSSDDDDVLGSPLAVLESSRALERELDKDRPPPSRLGGSAKAPSSNFESEIR